MKAIESEIRQNHIAITPALYHSYSDRTDLASSMPNLARLAQSSEDSIPNLPSANFPNNRVS